MKHRTGRGSVTACLAVFTVGLLASGCDWAQLGFDPSHSGDNSGDTTITPANVSTLTAHFSATDGTTGPLTAQSVVNGVLYATNAGSLEAYSASGTTGCSGSPTGCSPLWSYSPGPLLGNPAVVSGVVYAPTSSGLDAFDAAGHANCSGTPTVCQPLWSASGTFGTPTVSNGTVYVTTSGTLEAFDASGTTNCAGSPKVCSPVWTSSNAYSGTVTVSGGIAYALSFLGGTHGGIVALDANGTKGCSGSPKVCTPLWEDVTNYPVTGGYAVVSGTALYVDTFYSPGPRQFPSSDIESFDGNGVNGCSGTPKVCSPLWSDQTIALNTAPLAGDGSEFQSVPISGFGIYAVDPNGALEWNAPNSNATAIGGSVLYGTDGGNVVAYDAGGNAGCSGIPKICGSLWSAPGTDAIIANGTLYVSATNSSGDGEVVAYGLP
jgi:hypothetical protein